MAAIHDRMPVILRRDSWDRWLSRDIADPAELTPLLVPATDGTLIEHPVSTLVNDVRNNYAECITPLR